MEKSRLQVFVENSVASTLSILKVCLFSSFKIRFDQSDSDECVILGNGPSLKGFLANHEVFLKNKKLVCVNFFARTDLFEKLQPSYYVITSPEYFKGEKKSNWIADRNHTFEVLAEKTKWPLQFIVPNLARSEKEWKKYFKGHEHIKIVYFNNTPIEGFKSLNHFFFKKNLGMPRPHNVLIPSIFVALNMRYKKVYVAGADHSWTKEIFVDDNNQVLIGQKHFYDDQVKNDKEDKNKPTPKPMYKGGSKETRKLHEVLIKFVHSFQAYWHLREYADSRDTEIINVTKDSFIDAFKRQEL